MHHATPLITTIVGGLVLAFIFGMLANKLRISPLVGYLLAGVLAGPFTPVLLQIQACAGTGRTWRDPADVRRGATLFVEGFNGGKVHRHSRCDSPDSCSNGAGYGAFSCAGLVADGRYRLWIMSVYRQYRSATARA